MSNCRLGLLLVSSPFDDVHRSRPCMHAHTPLPLRGRFAITGCRPFFVTFQWPQLVHACMQQMQICRPAGSSWRHACMHAEITYCYGRHAACIDQIDRSTGARAAAATCLASMHGCMQRVPIEPSIRIGASSSSFHRPCRCRVPDPPTYVARLMTLSICMLAASCQLACRSRLRPPPPALHARSCCDWPGRRGRGIGSDRSSKGSS